jgi:hypothetical protein
MNSLFWEFQYPFFNPLPSYLVSHLILADMPFLYSFNLLRKIALSSSPFGIYCASFTGFYRC